MAKVRVGGPLLWILVFLPVGTVFAEQDSQISEESKTTLEKIGIDKGICVVLGLPEENRAQFVTDLARGSELLIYFQSPNEEKVTAVRHAAEAAGLLGTRIFADQGNWQSVHLADNLAGAMWVSASALGDDGVKREEILRVLHPEGKAIAEKVGEWETISKPFPKGIDPWSHPYHGPDNNPQSNDQVARAPFLTQFFAKPMFCPQPTVTVGAGGRLFKAFGHCATHANQNRWLNTLLGVNAFNGTILWRRELKEGFMIYRNTMIATPEVLYLGDDQSCKLIDPCTGEIKSEFTVPSSIADGPIFKWMALENETLFALVGGEEVKVKARPSTKGGIGSWPIKTQEEGYFNYKDRKTAPGFGRTFVAMDANTGKIIWSRQEQDYIDSRGVCMKNGRIYYYSPENFLGCLGGKAGNVLWKTADPALLKAIGPMLQERESSYGRIFFAETSYIKCNDQFIFLTGYQRPNLVVVSAGDGKLKWLKKGGDSQLVLRDDALYAIGWKRSESYAYAYETGEILTSLPRRLACTRATGSIDSIFYRMREGTLRYVPSSKASYHIAPMRPPCIDGVVVSEGLLYWGPWMCSCPLSLYGHIALSPAADFDFQMEVSEKTHLKLGKGDLYKVQELKGTPKTDDDQNSTTCGDVIFTVGSEGILRALTRDNKLIWKAYTAGGINFPPVIWEGRAYVGSNDGYVYAFEAATGRLLWRFLAAPVERRIPVYGELMSTWPVAGGVVVSDGVVYAAAGIAHYDGTHIYALDAVTGKIKWHNNSSGSILKREEAVSGISLQGKLCIEENKLVFCGGNACPKAVFDLATGKCLVEQGGPMKRTDFAIRSYLKENAQYIEKPPNK